MFSQYDNESDNKNIEEMDKKTIIKFSIALLFIVAVILSLIFTSVYSTWSLPSWLSNIIETSAKPKDFLACVPANITSSDLSVLKIKYNSDDNKDATNSVSIITDIINSGTANIAVGFASCKFGTIYLKPSHIAIDAPHAIGSKNPMVDS